MNIQMLAHVVFMPLAVMLTSTAALIAHNKKTNWFKLHRMLALAGAVCGILAFGFIFTLKIRMGYPHFQSPHAIAGAIAVVLLFVTLYLGLSLAAGKKAFRSVHKIFGKITVGVLAVALVMGVARLLMMLK
jgi:uncharacterized membrane protein YozB (DUF420 family)